MSFEHFAFQVHGTTPQYQSLARRWYIREGSQGLTVLLSLHPTELVRAQQASGSFSSLITIAQPRRDMTLSPNQDPQILLSSPTVLYFISLNTHTQPFQQMDCIRFCKHCNCLARLLLMLKNVICKDTHTETAHIPPIHTVTQFMPQVRPHHMPSVQCSLTHQIQN